MSKRIIFKQENEKDFWKYWQQYISKTQISPTYLKIWLDYLLILSKDSSLLFKDKSFVYLENNEVVACVFLPIEQKDNVFSVSIRGDYVLAPLFDNNKKLEKQLFQLIDEIALENNISKIMFSVDPLEKDRYSYNYLQKYNYLDTSILVYFINIKGSDDLLQNCREGYRKLIKPILKDNDFSTFYIDKNNPDYQIHKEYEILHYKCSGRMTRPQETFDIQYQELKQGNATLFGLKYKEKNITYCYFIHNVNKVIYISGADDPDYDKVSLYHVLIYSAMEHFRRKGVDYIDTGQPSGPSTQAYYYPDEKQLNISYFKRGFRGNFVENFRGVKYFSKQVFERDMNTFLKNYKETIKS